MFIYNYMFFVLAQIYVQCDGDECYLIVKLMLLYSATTVATIHICFAIDFG